jgi:hypothetical protein
MRWVWELRSRTSCLRVRIRLLSSATSRGGTKLPRISPCADVHGWTNFAGPHPLLIVEPLAGDRLEDNLTPLGRAYYAASTLNCVPTSLSRSRGLAIGAQAGEA